MSPLTLLYTQLRIYGLTRDLPTFLLENCRQFAATWCLLLKLEIYNSITREEKLICDLSELGWVIFTIITCLNSKKNSVYILDFLFFSNFLQPAHKSLELQCFAARAALTSRIFSLLEIFNILNIFSTLKYLILMKVFVYKKTPLRNFHRLAIFQWTESANILKWNVSEYFEHGKISHSDDIYFLF